MPETETNTRLQKALVQRLDPMAVNRHFSLIQTAMTAYCQNDDDTLGRLLRQIPYRSPYRDFCQLLKALSCLPEQAQTALTLLTRVPATSAFAPMVRIIRMVASEQVEQRDWREVTETSIRCIAKLRGLDPAVLCTYVDRAHTPENQSTVEARPGVSKLEAARQRALRAERSQALEQAIDAWQQVLHHIETSDTDSSPGVGVDHPALKTALILRRMAALHQQMEGHFTEAIESPLLTSLEADPDDKPSFLTLIAFYREMGEEDNYRRCVERALAQFPQDSEIVQIAVDLAIKRETFKKAARLAEAFLARDPIHPPLRQLLRQAHLAHARKQMLTGRCDLAGQEIDAAQASERSGLESGLIDVFRGVLAYKNGDAIGGELAIERACQKLSYLQAYFYTVLEAEWVQLAPRTVKPYLKLLKQKGRDTPDKHTVLTLLAAIQSYNEQQADPDAFESALAAITPYLRKAAALAYVYDEMEMMCECWWRLSHWQLLADFAEQAKTHWPEQPLFVFFQIYALSTGARDRVGPMDLERLNTCLEQADAQHDVNLVARIQAFIEQPDPVVFAEHFDAPFSFRN